MPAHAIQTPIQSFLSYAENAEGNMSLAGQGQTASFIGNEERLRLKTASWPFFHLRLAPPHFMELFSTIFNLSLDAELGSVHCLITVMVKQRNDGERKINNEDMDNH